MISYYVSRTDSRVEDEETAKMKTRTRTPSDVSSDTVIASTELDGDTIPGHPTVDASDRTHTELTEMCGIDESLRYFTCDRAADISGKTRSRTKNSTTKHSVSFHQVQIRRYPIIMGDNPSVQIGTPVTIDWHYDELPLLDLDAYENMRCGQRRTRLRNLILNFYQRQGILSRQGYSEKEQSQAEKEAAKVRRQRSMTVAFLPVSKLEEALQSAKRKLKRRLTR